MFARKIQYNKDVYSSIHYSKMENNYKSSVCGCDKLNIHTMHHCSRGLILPGYKLLNPVRWKQPDSKDSVDGVLCFGTTAMLRKLIWLQGQRNLLLSRSLLCFDHNYAFLKTALPLTKILWAERRQNPDSQHICLVRKHFSWRKGRKGLQPRLLLAWLHHPC